MMRYMRGKRDASQGNSPRNNASKDCTRAKPRLASRLTIVGFGVLTAFAFIPRSAAANDKLTAINAAMTVFGAIISIEVMIERCRVFDAVNAKAYDEVYRKYHETVEPTIFAIQTLLPEETRRAGIDKGAFEKIIKETTDNIATETARKAATNPGTFMEICRTLPKAINVGTKPFEPLRKSWPAEMRLIDEWR